MKTLTTLTGLLLFTFSVTIAQDKIVLESGKTIECEIIQETTSSFVYKKKKRAYTMDKYYIDKVKYANGEVKTIVDTLENLDLSAYEKTVTISVEDLKRKDGREIVGPMKIKEILISEDEEIMIILAYRNLSETLRIIDLNTLEVINDVTLNNNDKLFSKAIITELFNGFISTDKKYFYGGIISSSGNGKRDAFETKTYDKINLSTGEHFKIKCKDNADDNLNDKCGKVYVAPKYYEIINPAFKNVCKNFYVPSKGYVVKLNVEDVGEQDYCGSMDIYKRKEN